MVICSRTFGDWAVLGQGFSPRPIKGQWLHPPSHQLSQFYPLSSNRSVIPPSRLVVRLCLPTLGQISLERDAPCQQMLFLFREVSDPLPSHLKSIYLHCSLWMYKVISHQAPVCCPNKLFINSNLTAFPQLWPIFQSWAGPQKEEATDHTPSFKCTSG